MSRLCLFTVVCLLGLTVACTTEPPTIITDTDIDGKPLTQTATPTPVEYSSLMVPTTPTMTFDAFRDALYEGDIETIKHYTYSVEREACNWEHFHLNYVSNRDDIRDIASGATVESVETIGSKAVVMVRWGNGKLQMMDLIFEDGLWRMGGDKGLAQLMEQRELEEDAAKRSGPTTP